MLHTLAIGLLSTSFLIITPHGLSINTAKKTVQEKNLPVEAHACKETSPQNSCPVSELLSQNSINVHQESLKLQQESLKQVGALQQDQQFQDLQKQASEKAQLVLKDPSFQEWVATLQNKDSSSLKEKHFLPLQNQGDLYVFVSFSLGEKALLNLAFEAKRYGATLVLRGFKEESYAKTVAALHNIITKSGEGVIVDPELFSLFSVSSVPTFILTKPIPPLIDERVQTPMHDRLQGHVSIQYVLETIAKEGDLKAEAQTLLQNSSSQQEEIK